MNLQNKIRRILREEVNKDYIKNMIDKFGIYDAVRYLGGYDKVGEYIKDNVPKSEKIKIIRKRLDYINNSLGENEDENIWITEIGGEPIEYDGTDNYGLKDDYQQVEVLLTDGVIIYGYRDKYSGQDVGSFSLYYNDLPEDILNKIFKIVLEYKG